MEKRYKEIKKHLGITDAEVAKMFGYKSDNVFRNSTRRDKIVSGIIEFYDLVISDDRMGVTDA